MTDEDMRPKSAEELRADWNELVKEARTKIKPVLMTQEDYDKYVQPHDEKFKNNKLIRFTRNNIRKFISIFARQNIAQSTTSLQTFQPSASNNGTSV